MFTSMPVDGQSAKQTEPIRASDGRRKNRTSYNARKKRKYDRAAARAGRVPAEEEWKYGHVACGDDWWSSKSKCTNAVADDENGGIVNYLVETGGTTQVHSSPITARATSLALSIRRKKPPAHPVKAETQHQQAEQMLVPGVHLLERKHKLIVCIRIHPFSITASRSRRRKPLPHPLKAQRQHQQVEQILVPGIHLSEGRHKLIVCICPVARRQVTCRSRSFGGIQKSQNG